MGKAKKSNSAAAGAATGAGAEVAWPSLAPRRKPLGPPHVVVEDEVVVWDEVLSERECNDIIALFARPPPPHEANDGNNGAASSTARDKKSAATASSGRRAKGKAPLVGQQGQASQLHAMQPSPAPRKGDALRTNSRFATNDVRFAERLWKSTGLVDALADWTSLRDNGLGSTEQPAAAAATAAATGAPRARTRAAAGLNSLIRVYRYEPGQLFGAHYDGHVADPCPTRRAAGWSSEWTLLLYLSGGDGSGLADSAGRLVGGATRFYTNHSAREEASVDVEPRRGRLLLHRHGDACMLHEAMAVREGEKWVLRSDVMFAPVDVVGDKEAGGAG